MGDYSIESIVAALKKPKADPMLDPNSIEYRTAQAEKSAQETKDKLAAYNIAHGLNEEAQAVGTGAPAEAAQPAETVGDDSKSILIQTVCEHEWANQADDDEGRKAQFMASCIASKRGAGYN